MKMIDLRKELSYLYMPSSKEAALIRVPKFNLLMIESAGDPNTSREFQTAIRALFNLSYTLKYMVRNEQRVDYPVMALEGLWWTDDMATFNIKQKEQWKWS